MWIEDILKQVTPETISEYEASLTPYDPNKFEIVGAVPADLRPLIVRLNMFEREYHRHQLAGAGADPYAKQMCADQMAILGLVISFSLKCSPGITPKPDTEMIPGENWQLFVPVKSLIVVPNRRDMANIGRGMRLGSPADVRFGRRAPARV